LTDRNVDTEESKKGRCPVPRLPNNPDCDFSASLSNDKIDADIEENLFTSLVVGYSQLIDDSQVQFRIGEIVARAMSQPTRLLRR
jgi:hypothetical protein